MIRREPVFPRDKREEKARKLRAAATAIDLDSGAHRRSVPMRFVYPRIILRAGNAICPRGMPATDPGISSRGADCPPYRPASSGLALRRSPSSFALRLAMSPKKTLSSRNGTSRSAGWPPSAAAPFQACRPRTAIPPVEGPRSLFLRLLHPREKSRWARDSGSRRLPQRRRARLPNHRPSTSP